MAACRSHGNHFLCHTCLIDGRAFYVQPFNAVSEDCDDPLVSFANLPSRCEPIAAAYNSVAEEWRRHHPCRGPQDCNFFAKENGECADPDCTNFLCPRCGKTDHSATAECNAQPEDDDVQLVAAFLGRDPMQCRSCGLSFEFAGGCNHIT
ncbi:hypothetical protein J3E68DRAFT_393294 [Trichoderma sp. SZMC 28012]